MAKPEGSHASLAEGFFANAQNDKKKLLRMTMERMLRMTAAKLLRITNGVVCG